MVKLNEKPFYLSEAKQEWVKETLKGMTAEEKCAQLFCTACFGNVEQVIELYKKIPFGSIMYRPMDSKMIRETNNRLQSLVKIPLLVAANLEAGGAGAAADGTFYGSQLQVAATGKVENAYNLGEISAAEGADMGVNLAFAPVVDINYNWRNPITNVRTYGSDADFVRRCGSAYMKGAHKHNVAVSIKHFPGDGVDERDQHIVASCNSLSTEEWDETYGRIYKTLIDEGAETVMAGHILQPAYELKFNPSLKTDEIMPATLSKELITDLLRGQLGFNGVVITDASNMVGMCCSMERRKLCPASINAGCDIFLFGRNMEEDYGYMLEAVADGTLSMERLDEAVTRILALKAKLGLDERKPITDEHNVGSEEHHARAVACADEAVTLVKDTQNLLPVTPERYKRVWLHIIDEPGFTDSTTCRDAVIKEMKAAGFEVFYDDEEPKTMADTQERVDALKAKYDIIIYFANIVNASYKTVTRLKWRQPAAIDAPYFTRDIPTMFVSLANPYHFADVPMIKTIINAYSPSEDVIHAVVEKMTGRSSFKGVNPVDPFCGLWGQDY